MKINERAAHLLQDGVLTISDAVAFSGIGKTTLIKLLDDKEIAWTRIGRRRLVAKRSLIEYLAKGLRNYSDGKKVAT